jgi:Flp pilus assembly protein TadD
MTNAMQIYNGQGPAAAVPLLQKLADKNPTNGAVLTNLGTAQIAAGLYNEAEGNLMQATRHISANPKPYNNLGALYIAEGHWESAELALNAALEIDQDNTDAILNLGILNEKQKKWDSAIQFYKKYLEMSDETDPLSKKLSERIRVLTSLSYWVGKENGDGNSQ